METSRVLKRIKKEIEELISYNVCVEDQVEIKNIDDCEYNIIIKNLFDKKNCEFKMYSNHPFKPPKLVIDNRLISFHHKAASKKFSNDLTKHTGIQCFCCETILCSNNWSPQFTLKDVIYDIYKYRDARHQVVIRTIVDVVKRKYLVDDINIIEWLY